MYIINSRLKAKPKLKSRSSLFLILNIQTSHAESLYPSSPSVQFVSRIIVERVGIQKTMRKNEEKSPSSHLICEHPQEAQQCSHLGDWEVDTVLGKQKGACLVTLADRKSRFLNKDRSFPIFLDHIASVNKKREPFYQECIPNAIVLVFHCRHIKILAG